MVLEIELGYDGSSEVELITLLVVAAYLLLFVLVMFLDYDMAMFIVHLASVMDLFLAIHYVLQSQLE